MRMFQLNYPMNPALILRSGAPGSPLPRLASQIDRGLFDLRHPDDLGDCLHLLCAVTGSSILTGLQSGDPAPARTRLVRVFDILQRGMSSKESRP